MADWYNFPEWFDVNAGKDPKVMRYRGGSASTESYVFPQRKHVTNELLRVGGEPLLERFSVSKFGSVYTEGGIQWGDAKKMHRISAYSVVAGWMSNQAIWDNFMVEDMAQRFNFDFKGANSDSVLDTAGLLFGSDEDPLPFELRQELYAWLVKRKGHGHVNAVMDIVDVTGMTVEDYGTAFRITGYNHLFTDYLSLEHDYRNRGFSSINYQEGLPLITEISNGLRAVNNTSRDAWSWLCAMRQDTEKREKVIESIFELASYGVKPLDYSEVRSKGLKDASLVKMVLSGELDLELALRVEAA